MEKIYNDPQIGEVLLKKSTRCRRISIRVHPVKGVTLSMPYRVPYAVGILFLKAKRQWVLDTVARQRERKKDVQTVSPQEIEGLRRRAKAELPPRLATLAARYGFTFERVAIKHNSTNWGSCSTKNNINLNLNIMRLPYVLQDYILLHELCHLRHHDHGQAFHLLLEHVLTDNMMRLMEEMPGNMSPADTALISDLARKAEVSKARYPLDYVMTRAIKQFRLI